MNRHTLLSNVWRRARLWSLLGARSLANTGRSLTLLPIENQPKSREFRRVGEPTRIFQFEKNQKGLKLWVVSREKATEVCKRQKGWTNVVEPAFRCSSMVSHLWWLNLVALLDSSWGRSLTISIRLMDIVVFCRFSFMTLWDGVQFARTFAHWFQELRLTRNRGRVKNETKQ